MRKGYFFENFQLSRKIINIQKIDDVFRIRSASAGNEPLKDKKVEAP